MVRMGKLRSTLAVLEWIIAPERSATLVMSTDAIQCGDAAPHAYAIVVPMNT